jgi:hypothetical protein
VASKLITCAGVITVRIPGGNKLSKVEKNNQATKLLLLLLPVLVGNQMIEIFQNL